MSDDRPVTNQIKLPDGSEVRLATPQARIIARLIDTISMIGLWYVFELLFGFSWLDIMIEDSDSGFSVESIGFVFSAILIVTADSAQWADGREGVTGQSLGQTWTGVRIVAAQDGGTIPYHSLFVRAYIPYLAYLIARFLFNQSGFDEGVRWELSWTVVAIPILPLFWSSYRQGWHDNAVGTIVIAEESFAAMCKSSAKEWYTLTRPLVRLRSLGKSSGKALNHVLRNLWSAPISVFRSWKYYFGMFNLFVLPVFGIVFWLDYMQDNSKEQCYAVLDAIYEQASIEQLEASDSPQVFVDTLIIATLENRDELLKIEYLERVSADRNCEFDSLQKYADNWSDDYQQELRQREEAQDLQVLDVLWSKFPKE